MNLRAPLAGIARASDLINHWLARAGGVAVTIAVVMLIGVMIVPTTPQVMDILIGTNIALAITVLLVALYIQDANRLPSFPTILLITTLFRLALNVSSTRLIISEAQAGEIIAAFGQFVVGGNFIVGAVIFLIITVIQFIVITKGSERVAEVSARFTLDAMGGKQMAIDADLRANLISPEEAKDRRRRLDAECKLYGAMDGAMKFVKGDAIAGIIISLINVLGGLLIGHLQMGFPLAEAASRFTLLSIGDGLVSQFPALLISIAAGLVVTRVASDLNEEAGDGYAGKEILEQMLSQPVALTCVALMLTLLGVLPTGLPAPVFLSLAAVFAIIAIPQLPVFRRTAALDTPNAAAGRAGSKPVGPAGNTKAAQPETAALYPTPIRVHLGSALAGLLIPKSRDWQEFVAPGDDRPAGRIEEILRLLRKHTGVTFPSVLLSPSATQPPDGYCIELFECPVERGRFSPEDVLLPCHEREARRLGFDTRPTSTPWNGAPACLVRSQDCEAAREAGLRPLEAEKVVEQHIYATLSRYAAEFVGVQDVQSLIEDVEHKLPNLKDAVVPKPLTVAQITAVLQRLLREQVPIRNLRLILETLARIGPRMSHPLDLAEAVRRALGRELCHHLASANGVLRFFRLSAEIEQLIAASLAVDPEEGTPIVTLTTDARAAIVAGVNAALQESWRRNEMPVILTTANLRLFVRTVLESSHPALHVLSDQELAGAALVRTEWLGEIALAA